MQQRLVHHSRGAQRIVRGLDQGVFKGTIIMGWVGDNFKHGVALCGFTRAALMTCSVMGGGHVRVCKTGQRTKTGRFENLPYAATVKRAQWQTIGFR
ncbi:hypothetical protein BR1R5_41200 [Pseudomonas sp. BR1R-5]|nr:hypothetical protein BR1R5_41200 [Pseudomonas sp. BR1R-5]